MKTPESCEVVLQLDQTHSTYLCLVSNNNFSAQVHEEEGTFPVL